MRQTSPTVPGTPLTRRAHALYQAGSDHLFFWDTNARNDFSPAWDALHRLGHRRKLEEWSAAGMPEHKPAGSRLRKLGHWNLDYETPG